MRRFWLTLASTLLCTAPAWADAARTPLVVELRLNGQALEAMAWRDETGAFYTDPTALAELGVTMPAGAAPQTPLAAVAGLSARYIESDGALVLTCTAACFAAQRIDASARETRAIDRAAGGFLNADLSATASAHKTAAAGLFELGLFNAAGAGGANWLVSERGETIRMETFWSVAWPRRRLALTLGDSITATAALGAPVRFGGVQIGTDFALDPGYITFPTPTLHGAAAAPSTVDLYVDGALRLRERVDAGPFALPDAPVLSGAGVAQIVVTDALGRQQVFAERFYASPAMLRRGLTAFSVTAGAERRNFTRASADYGPGFVSGLMRYGISNYVTVETRADLKRDGGTVGAAGSYAAFRLGQIDLAYAQAYGAHRGALTEIAWTRQANALSFSLQARAASADFRQLGDAAGRKPPRLQTTASLGANFGAYGGASFAVTELTPRGENRVRTYALSYTPRESRWGQINFSALYVDEAERPTFSFGVNLSVSLAHDVTSASRVETRGGRITASSGVQRAAPESGGFGWRAAAAAGADRRIDAALTHLGPRHEADLEYAETKAGAAVRARLAGGLAWIGRDMALARPVRESFALVDAGAPHVRITRDNRVAGITNARGRVLLTGLRAYESNRIGLALDDLPLALQPDADSLELVPGARSGAIARFHIAAGPAGEARVADSSGAPLPEGTVLTRADGARFPVGAGGRIYVSGLNRPQSFRTGACSLDITPADLSGGALLLCRPAA